MNPIYGHPLIGVSPISACALAAGQGLEIQEQQTQFFKNGARPGGILSAPKQISDITAKRLEETFRQNYGGENVGQIAVLGDGLTFEHSTYKPVDAQLIEQLKYSSEMVCTAFHVPPYKVGVGPTPTYQNAAILNQIYYSDCLQAHIEGIEALIDEGLNLPPRIHVEFVIDDLLRMDALTQVQVLKEAVGAGIMAPNEARKRIHLPPVEGGDEPFLQQQNWSLADLARRRELIEMLDISDPNGAPPQLPAPASSTDQEGESALDLLEMYRKEACPILN